MEIQHILVPIDFSPCSEAAFDFAVDLARRLGARLTLLHVIHVMPLGVAGGEATLPYAYLAEIEQDAQQALTGYQERAREAGVSAETRVVHGIPPQSIVEIAQDAHADLIVMGTHGRTGLQHILLGSVAERVLRQAPCPVLTVRQHEASAWPDGE